jgi:Tfp pilus assembly protein PilF
MTPRWHFLTRAIRRPRVMVAVLGGLLLAGLAGVVLGRVVWPAMQLHAAERALVAHDPADARIRLEQYLAHWPADPPALLLAARAARQLDAYADAERFLTSFEQASTPTDESHLEWILLGAQQGDFNGEESRLRNAVERHDPQAPAIVVALAKGYMACFRRSEALALLNEFLERTGGDVPALVLRGTVWESLHQTNAAAEDFGRAVELAPESAAAHSALAGHLNREGHTREAIYYYQLAQRRRSGDPTILLGLARAYNDAAEPGQAERCLNELLSITPDDVEALVERGRAALRHSQYADAERFLARAVRKAPGRREAHQLYALVLQELGRTDEAAQEEARLAELRAEDAVGGRLKLRGRDAPGDVGIRLQLWQWALRNGDLEDGAAWLFEILRLHAKHAEAHVALADYFDRLGQPRRAALHRRIAAGSSAASWSAVLSTALDSSPSQSGGKHRTPKRV